MVKTVIKALLIIFVLQISLYSKEININQIINSTKISQKPLLVWLHKTDCGYCESMREFTLENEIINSFLDKYFIFIHINVSKNDTIIYKKFHGSGRNFAKKMGYDFYPTSLFFDSSAEIIYSEVGYRDSKTTPNENRFYTILNFIKSKSYKSMDYEDYTFDIKEKL